jgi:uncharacterized membrane protein YkoI
MLRPSTSPRRVLGLALALSIGAGIGLGALSPWSASGATTPQDPRAETTAIASTRPDVPATAAPASPWLTLDEAQAVAAQVAPGRVVEADEDSEPTGLRYDVTVLHDDGTATEIEVDAATGRVVSTKLDDDWNGR